MANNSKLKYPSKVDLANAAYEYGAARNVVSFGDGTGTPWDFELVNDFLGYQQASLLEAGVIPTNTPDTGLRSQYLDAAKKIHGFSTASLTTLRALDSSNLVTGTKIKVDQVDQYGDFEVKDGTVTDNDTDLIVFDDDANRYCKRMLSSVVDLGWLGAVTNATSLDKKLIMGFHNTDSKARIQSRDIAGYLDLELQGSGGATIIGKAFGTTCTVYGARLAHAGETGVFLRSHGSGGGAFGAEVTTLSHGFQRVAAVSDLLDDYSDQTLAAYTISAPSSNSQDVNKYTNTGTVTLTLDDSTGWSVGQKLTLYYPSDTGTGTVDIVTGGSITLVDNRPLNPGYKAVITYEGSDVFNYTGP